MLVLIGGYLFLPPSMVYISVIFTQMHITNAARPLRAAISTCTHTHTHTHTHRLTKSVHLYQYELEQGTTRDHPKNLWFLQACRQCSSSLSSISLRPWINHDLISHTFEAHYFVKSSFYSERLYTACFQADSIHSSRVTLLMKRLLYHQATTAG